MRAFDRAARAERGGRLRAILLIAVLALGLLHVSQPIHLHDATSLGLYNEAHVLAALESVTVNVPLPDAPPRLAIALVPGAAPVAADVAPPALVSGCAQSRAPPLV